MKRSTNILNSKSLRWMSLLLSFIICFNLSLSSEEEVRETEKETEIELIHQISKVSLNEVDFDESNQKSFFKKSHLKFHSKKENYIPFLNVKRYIFYCQLALKGCNFNIFKT